MSRIIETTNATLTSEAVAPRIVIQWNPVDDSGLIRFEVERMESVNGEFQRLVREDDISIALADFMQREVTVAGQIVPPELIVGYIKQIFDDLYTERAGLVSEPAAETPEE